MNKEIPQWVNEYNKAGHLSSAGRAVSILMVKVAALESLIEKAFVAGRSQTSWEQFKKDNKL